MFFLKSGRKKPSYETRKDFIESLTNKAEKTLNDGYSRKLFILKLNEKDNHFYIDINANGTKATIEPEETDSVERIVIKVLIELEKKDGRYSLDIAKEIYTNAIQHRQTIRWDNICYLE